MAISKLKARLLGPIMLACLSSACAARASAPASPWGPGPFATLATAKRVVLTVRPSQKVFVSGSGVPLVATFLNRGRIPLLFPQLERARAMFNRMRVMYLPTGRHAGPLLDSPLPNELYSENTTALGPLRPGRSVRFWKPIEIGRYADMTMPGKYLVQLDAGVAKSNTLAVRMVSPKWAVVDGAPAIVPAVARTPVLSKQRSPLMVFVRQDQGAPGGPVSISVCIRAAKKKHDMVIRLSGDALVDIRAVQVVGPDGVAGDRLVSEPKPHHAPIPNWKPAPHTAYGEWLQMHPPKKLPGKTYDLKPGVVYKYAVPINLSCQYDMSLAGVYHVRVELAHPKIWSNWVTVKVPS